MEATQMLYVLLMFAHTQYIHTMCPSEARPLVDLQALHKALTIFVDFPFQCDGQITSVDFYARNTGIFYVAAWRPNQSEDAWTLIGYVKVNVTKAAQSQTYVIPVSERLVVKATDVLGIMYTKGRTRSIVPSVNKRRNTLDAVDMYSSYVSSREFVDDVKVGDKKSGLRNNGKNLKTISMNVNIEEVDWTECWEEVTVDDIPADCYTATKDDAIVYDTRDIPTIYDRFDARRHCGTRSESRYLYTKPVYDPEDDWIIASSCINNHGICLQTKFSDNYGQMFYKINTTLWDQVEEISFSEMPQDDDCTGDGLISEWVYDPTTYIYNIGECLEAGGTHFYDRLANLEASCYPKIECTVPAEDQTVYRKKAECIST